ncbi:MAG: RDD family protein [Terriglobia bacterium]
MFSPAEPLRRPDSHPPAAPQRTDSATEFLAGGLNAPAASKPRPPAAPQHMGGAESGWAGEISERAASFRRRRDTAGEAPERDATLRFDFDGAGWNAPLRGVSPEAGFKTPAAAKAGNILDRAFEDRASRGNQLDLGSVPLDRPVRPIMDQAASRVNRPGKAPGDFVESPRSRPIMVEFAGTPLSASRAGIDPDEISVAPLSKRFLAGVLDGFILLAAACLFAGLFTLARGRLEPRSLDLAVVAFIALFWVFFYFGLFTALALRTPGQSAMGLTVRNLDGDPPTRQEALLRAFGYLVSIVALMIGFLWAAMDGDGMAWHDHISGTLLVEEHGLPAGA